MSRAFPQLTSPGRIGGLTLKNRMLVTAMGVNLGEPDASCGERLIAYHQRQAAGGAALIITGVASVGWPNGSPMPGPIGLSEDRFITGLSELVSAVHRHDCLIAAQLHHGGINAAQDIREGRALWVPSLPPMPAASDLAEGMLPAELQAFAGAGRPELHVVSEADIAQLIAWYAAAAERARQAGFDALELHAGHGYLLSGFLSPAMNSRADAYGGSLENRARLLLEIIAAIRARCGRDFPLWVKLDCGEYGRHEGITLADAVATAQLVEQAGVDAITASAYHDTSRGALHSESNVPFEPERMVADAMAIRRAVGIPVIASGRIEPSAAERHLRSGHFDFLAMGRKILADPDLPNKLAAGRADDIRPCVYCYCCVSRIYTLQTVKCAVNPETARERERALVATDRPRAIAVAGGGPAGMEVACRLRQRGFAVTLFEAAPRLGGTLQFASIAYAPNERLLHWLRREVRTAGIEVVLNTPVTAAQLRQRGIDEVVVASGARRAMPDIPGADLDFVFSGDEMRALVMSEDMRSLQRKTTGSTRLLMRLAALLGVNARPAWLRFFSRIWLPVKKQVTIIGAELVGLELAEFLAHRGCQVTVLSEGSSVGEGLYVVRRLRLLEELRHLRVTLIRQAGDIAIEPGRVGYTNYRGQRRHLATRQVIIATGATGNADLADALSAEGFTVHSIGDCQGVGYIEGAIHDAAELATRL